MYTKRHYSFLMTVNWSKKPLLWGLLFAGVICAVQYFTELDLSLPWQPISIMGIAVAFYLGFKNNSSYDRTWEARKIWGAIVNYSRTFSTAIITMIDSDHADAHKRLIYRHIAWMTALRYQLRLSRPWEHTNERIKGAYQPTVCERYMDGLQKELKHLISPDEMDILKPKSNMASQLLLLQSKDLKSLHDRGILSDYKHVRLHEMIGWLYDEQGKSERIKNFPFPRQYASTALWLTFVFSALIPFGIIDIFSQRGDLIWLSVPFSALIIWIFFLMEMIGDYSENPFEGTYNDVPITSIAKSIEIDIREMLNDSKIPEPMKEVNGFLM